jgi:hypothetical protein
MAVVESHHRAALRPGRWTRIMRGAPSAVTVMGPRLSVGTRREPIPIRKAKRAAGQAGSANEVGRQVRRRPGDPPVEPRAQSAAEERSSSGHGSGGTGVGRC